jgi:hypothetical protein
MLSSASAAGLVAGGASAPSAPDLVRIRVLRSFIWEREPVAVGTEMQVPARWAKEMAWAGKLEILPEEPAPTPEPAPTRRAAKEPKA